MGKTAISSIEKGRALNASENTVSLLFSSKATCHSLLVTKVGFLAERTEVDFMKQSRREQSEGTENVEFYL